MLLANPLHQGRAMTTITKDKTQYTSAELCVRRSGIRFHNVSLDRVHISVEVENQGRARSSPTPLRIESAPLGAFVRWRPLATLRVPPIPAGGSTIVQTVVRQPRPGRIPGLSGLVPPGLLTATGAGDERRRADLPGPSMLIHRLLQSMGILSTCELPPDLQDLLAGTQPHWAGNLNVWIGRKPVERHRAPRLRIHAGMTNLAMFLLGDRPDQYAFHVEGSGAGWSRALYDTAENRIIDCEPGVDRRSRWCVVNSMRPLLLALRPPEFCGRGNVELHVTQRSSGETAVVEFDLDPTADGPGCYTV